jgi:hypothetical protein
MSDISNQLIKDSYNYVLQSDLSTGIVYRIGGGIPVNPKFLSGLTINNSFNYSDGTEQPGFVLITDAFGNATWGPISGSSSGNYLSLSGGTVTGPTIFTSGLTANTFSASTYLGLPIDIRVTGATKSGSVATFTNNTGGTFTLTGLTDVFVTGATKSGSVATFRNSTGGTFTLTGLTDTFVTGGTYSSSTGITTFRNNTGGTFTVTGYFTPSNDIYVTSGQVDHGPNSNADNLLLLTRSDLTNVTISNLVNISDTTKSEIDSLIPSRWIIRGKTYKISGCDNSLYYNGTDRRGDPVYTSIYLMGLEGNKLSESGIGVFYTPKYSEFDIFVDGTSYNKDNTVIWGGYVWICNTSGDYNSIDLFTLDPIGFDIIYPFDGSDAYNTSLYNIQYDDIIYDYTNDRIIYRNEENSNIVSTTYENINYWINDMSLYNPIRAFQWGNVYTNIDNNPNGIGNQRIINSYNENINYRGLYQKDFYFNNLSYQNNLYVANPICYQSNFIFDNHSYQTNISLEGIDGYPANQSYFNFNNSSYQDTITIRSGDGTPGIQSYFNFNNNSYQTNILLREREQDILDFTNNSGQDSINGCNQNSLIFDSSTQVNGNGFNQLNITIKNYDRDLSSVTVNEQDEFYIHNLPSDDTAPVYIGKINNRLVEVTKPQDIFVTGGTYDTGTSTITFTNNSGGTFNVSGITSSGGGSFTGGTVTGPTIFTNGLTANTISATTYQNLPIDIRVTGGTYTNGTATFRNNTGGTFNVTGLTTPFTGGTVTGATNFTGGLTSTTISATTYQNLPQDIFVTGGTYASGNAIFTNNTGGTFTVTGFAVGSGGGQLFYLNLSQSEGSNRLLSTTASTSPQQTSGVTISSGVTSSIASFQSPQLNTILIPGGVWSFHLHSYKEDTNSSFDIFVEVYKRTSGGAQTLLFQTEPTTVLTDSPLPSMQITEAYFSGTSLVVSDSIVTIVRATNIGNQTKIITLVTEGTTYYSYVVSSLPTQQGLTCDTLSGCSIIQTIQTDVSNKLDKSGGTITGDLVINSGLTAITISATTYLNLPSSGGSFTGGTVSGATIFTGGLTANTISATTITSPSISPYGLIVATSLGYQNIF